MRLLRNLARDTRGATLVEFAMVSPVLIVMLLGLFDMGHNYYVQSQLQGAVQQAARDATIEGAGAELETIDSRVKQAVHDLIPGAEVTFSLKAYATFSDVSQPEDFDDIDGNGSCDNGEPFEDANDNGMWDDDRGSEGVGGARDAVLYRVDISYKRLFAISSFIGIPDQVDTQASTVLRNQPYGDQVQPVIGNCA